MVPQGGQGCICVDTTLHIWINVSLTWPCRNVTGTIRSWFWGAFTPILRAVCCDQHICPATLKRLQLVIVSEDLKMIRSSDNSMMKLFRKLFCLQILFAFLPNLSQEPKNLTSGTKMFFGAIMFAFPKHSHCQMTVFFSTHKTKQSEHRWI